MKHHDRYILAIDFLYFSVELDSFILNIYRNKSDHYSKNSKFDFFYTNNYSWTIPKMLKDEFK